jgi:hypothetical protein
MAFPFNAVAVYEFEAANEGEMGVKVGDVVVVTGEVDGGWYVCTNSSGDTGYVPAGFVEAQEEEGKTEESSQSEAGSVSPKKSKDGSLKKRSSKKKLIEGGKLKSSDEKVKHKKEKSKDAPAEVKKAKKTKKSATIEAPGLSEPLADDKPIASVSASTSTSPSLESTSPKSLRALPLPIVPTNSQQSNGATTSPRNVRFGPPTPSVSGSIATPSTNGSESLQNTSTSQPISTTTPQIAGQNAAANNAGFPPGSTSPPNSSEKKLPPVVPQKRLSTGDGNRSNVKTGTSSPHHFGFSHTDSCLPLNTDLLTRPSQTNHQFITNIFSSLYFPL